MTMSIINILNKIDVKDVTLKLHLLFTSLLFSHGALDIRYVNIYICRVNEYVGFEILRILMNFVLKMYPTYFQLPQ